MEDGVGAILVEAALMLAAAMMELVGAVIALLVYLIELCLWLLLHLIGRSGGKPERRKIEGPGWMRKRSVSGWARSLVIGATVLAVGGYAMHESLFLAEVEFVSKHGGSPTNLEYEWVGKNGETEPGKRSWRARSKYTTYRWSEIRIRDPRYNPRTIALSGEDQVVQLEPTVMQDLKERALGKGRAVAGKVLDSALEYVEQKNESEQ